MTEQKLDHDILMSFRLVSKACCAVVVSRLRGCACAGRLYAEAQRMAMTIQTPKLFASTTVKLRQSPEGETLQPEANLRCLFHELVLNPVLLNESALLLLETWLRQDLATYASVKHVDIIFQRPRYLDTTVLESMEAFRFKEELVRLSPPHVSLGFRFRNDEARWGHASHLGSGYTREFRYCTYLGRLLEDLLRPSSHAIRSLSLQEMYVTPAALIAMTSLPQLEVLEWLGSWHPDIEAMPCRFKSLRELVFRPSLTISGLLREHANDVSGTSIFNICARNQVDLLRMMLEGSAAALRHLSLHMPVHKVQDTFSEYDYIYEPAQLRDDCWFGSDGSVLQRSYSSLLGAFSDEYPPLELPMLSLVQLGCASSSESCPSMIACLSSLLRPGAGISMPKLRHIDVKEEGNTVASSVPWESVGPDTTMERLDKIRYAIGLCDDRQIALRVSLSVELDEGRGEAARLAGVQMLEIVALRLWHLNIRETLQSFHCPAAALPAVRDMVIPQLKKLGVREAPGILQEGIHSTTESSCYQHRPLLALLAAVRVQSLEKVEWHGRGYGQDTSSLCAYTNEPLGRMLEQIEGGECPSLQEFELSNGIGYEDTLVCLAVEMGFQLAVSRRADNRYSSLNFCSSQPLPRPS